MASADSGDADDEASAEGNEGGEGDADAGEGGEVGNELSAHGSEANEEDEGNETEATPFFNDEMEEAAPMSLLSKGDTLPLSYRSDNGTRESEFYFDDDDKENINPYYDVVRRLSPTELIGRFMRTSSPRVSD